MLELAAPADLAIVDVGDGLSWSSAAAFRDGVPAAAPGAASAVLGGRAAADALALSFLGSSATIVERQTALAAAQATLAPDGVLIVIDHNRPRQRVAALAAPARSPRVPGATLAARWRRLSYLVARETRDAGFKITALRLAAGERVQVVLARKPDRLA